MANIKPRVKKDGTVSYLITVSLGRDADGKKLFKTTTFVPKSKAATKAQKEAEMYAADYERLVLRGEEVVDEDITFRGFATKIWEKNWLPAKTPSVQDGYKSVLKKRVYPFIGDRKLLTIRATDIDKILKDETASGKSARTVRTTAAVINSVLKYAYKKKYIYENPFLRCDDLPSVESRSGKELHYFTKEQAMVFLHRALKQDYTFTIKGHERMLKQTGQKYQVSDYDEHHRVSLQWQIYFMISVYGGLRKSELCALTWKDINEKDKTISINKAMSATKEKGQFIKDTKTKAGNREIVLPAECFVLLKQWKQEQKIQCIKLGSEWKGSKEGKKDDAEDSFDNNYVFIQDNGLPIHLATPSHKFGEIVDWYNRSCEKEEDKLPKIRLHDLRHTSATLLLSRNTDIETVARRLGHSKPSVTLDIYGHALPENDRKASDLMEEMFAQ